ncbi:hypothetical protein CRE_04474 [Caenorhabditis remanei]|uniref:RBR-type E3 ubiquitin transferase n=1 Tax=Caenorhabditis remanei TaxID=31234 RepID=E3NUS6_CAERE|nr:hypothetical protein CRE_04474 [Caenorhabditis remanei]
MNTENLENEGLPVDSTFGENWHGVQKVKADDRQCMGDAMNVEESRDEEGETEETNEEIEYDESEGVTDEEDEEEENDGCLESCDNDTDYLKNNKILSLDKLESEMKDIISDVETILEVSTGISQNLLQKFRWNKETLLEKFYGSEDTNEFLMNQNVIPSDPEDFPSEENTQCAICFDDESVLTGLSCNHQFCIGCWNSYLTQKIVDGETEISCMAPECTLLFQPEQVLYQPERHIFIVFRFQITFYINDPTVMSMYRKAVVSNYVDTNRLLKWCHGAGCEKVIKVPHASIRHVACSCGSQFCFSCNKDSHEPASCHILTHWLKMDDQESSKWILSNTKDCPKCQAPIEKNGGCNHMTCTNRNCRYEFCWLCMGDWRKSSEL